jgi:hypothetical protein
MPCDSKRHEQPTIPTPHINYIERFAVKDIKDCSDLQS